jgi:serralysin
MPILANSIAASAISPINVLGWYINGTDLADDLYGSVDNDEIHGRQGNDFLAGGAGDDLLFGEEGDDGLYGGTGNDTLNGGTGNDYLVGGAGNDWLYGGWGNDFFIGGEGADHFDGGDTGWFTPEHGYDTVSYETSSAGVTIDLKNNTATGGDAEGDTFYAIEKFIGSNYADTLIAYSNSDYDVWGKSDYDGSCFDGGAGDDSIYGGGGRDYLRGGAGHDLITGRDGDDQLYGDAGNDDLWGGYGNDQLYGGDGHDWLAGGYGDDIISGGAGVDGFIFNAEKWGFRERIVDFSHAEGDYIDLSAIDANQVAAGDQAFAFIGGSAFSGKAGQLHFVNGVVEGDLNGDRHADFYIEMNATSLSASDFIL